jgi:hypothetical protein
MFKNVVFFRTLFQFQGKCNQEFLLNRYTVLQLKQVLLIALEPNTWSYNILYTPPHHPFTIFKFFHAKCSVWGDPARAAACARGGGARLVQISAAARRIHAVAAACDRIVRIRAYFSIFLGGPKLIPETSARLRSLKEVIVIVIGLGGHGSAAAAHLSARGVRFIGINAR